MRTLYKLSIPVTPTTEARTAQLLQDVFQTTACVETDVPKGATSVSVYLDRAPSRVKLRSRLPRFTVRKLRHQNWAESWKRHFPPIEIGSELLIKPSWSRRKPKRNQALLVLDPGLSFGTGQHPTTRFCLEQVVEFRQPGRTQAFLDVGTGSGILAIAAAKLGYAPVEAFEIDPDALRVARANAVRNHVLGKLRLACKDLAAEPGVGAQEYDLICANLLSDLLLRERDRLVSCLKPFGRLVLAGILTLEFPEIRAAFEQAGLQLAASRAGDEWKSGAFDQVPTGAENSKK